MADEGHVAVLRGGPRAWNQWRIAHPEIIPDLSDIDLCNEHLIGADFSFADLSGANLATANLGRANYGKVNLMAGANLNEANLTEANLSFARMTGANLVRANLSYAKVSHTDLTEADLSGACLCKADLSYVDLREANLTGTNFEDVNLTQAHCEYANLKRASLRKADLSGAHFAGVDLIGTLLEAASFHAVRIGSTSFVDVDLSSVTGLDSVHHTGPSSIGMDTLYRSKGNIPNVFLRGAGVPESLIANMKALVGAMEPIQFYSLFISYSTADQEFAERLHADLQAKGIRCWFAPHDIQGGRKIHEQIDEAIRLHDKLLLILSPDSMQSRWVNTEIAKARKREIRDKARVLFPVRLVSFETLRDWECFDADAGWDSAQEIREYFIPDFSNWKDHDSYRKAFDRLLKDLQAPARVSR